MVLKTRVNASGRSHAAVKAQIAPLDGTADGAVVAALREDDLAIAARGLLLDLGQKFIEQEAGVGVAEAVVLVAAVEARQRVLVRGRHHAGRHEHADRHRHRLLGDELVEHGRRVVLHAVLVHVHARGRLAVVLLRDVHRDGPRRAGEHLALVEREGKRLALGNSAGLLGFLGETTVRHEQQWLGEATEHDAMGEGGDRHVVEHTSGQRVSSRAG